MSYSDCVLDIKSPYIKDITEGGGRRICILPVRATSRIEQRKAVFWMARYFGREFGYATMYGWNGQEDDMTATAYLWVDRHLLRNCKVPCIGGCCFRQREEGGPALQWIWINPFRRRQGILSGSWNLFEKNHPNFAVEDPLSEPMLRFLENRGHKDGIRGWHLQFATREGSGS